MSTSLGVKYTIALESLADLAGDNHLNVLDLRVLLYMIAKCEFRVLTVHNIGSFHIVAPHHFPAGMAGCYIYNGKRSEICDDLHYMFPQNVSRAISLLNQHGYLSKTYLGMRALFAFMVHPKFFDVDLGKRRPVNASPPKS